MSHLHVTTPATPSAEAVRCADIITTCLFNEYGYDFRATTHREMAWLIDRETGLLALKAELDESKARVTQLALLLDEEYKKSAQRGVEVLALAGERDGLKARVAELEGALRALLKQVNNIEVLGEWEALEINRSLRKTTRAKVDAVINAAWQALSHPESESQMSDTR